MESIQAHRPEGVACHAAEHLCGIPPASIIRIQQVAKAAHAVPPSDSDADFTDHRALGVTEAGKEIQAISDLDGIAHSLNTIIGELQIWIFGDAGQAFINTWRAEEVVHGFDITHRGGSQPESAS